ncbi:SDR family NAD(P)-dependent oxidoreductase [Thalassospira sp.]|uniref:SDR family NAD(P)-dependent oxidoreductase n=1 Tax=Thalassospira sp. TaxID=1912094 RepID=UPI001B0B4B83|nr:SDR family NAD(P)-dependent oxidoreductase [Thalassospira sp.]MBO6808540.1 SDR family NAD(P)-dependent oxidoreductase [Thalassospira sp.]MBO6839762.1 SDR family NAD(P)-dependent oxidoreductase [Thalassospira sp.]
MSFQYNAILITGASSGIGAALARHFARTGVTLFISGRNQTRLQLVENDCRAAGANVYADILDVTSRETMEAYVTHCDEIAPLSLVIANAGISAGTGGLGESPEQVRDIFATNVAGVLNTIDPAIKVMRARKRGQIALVASQASWRGLPSAPAYCASKATVRVYGEGLRGALAPDGVKVNVICPGFVKSRITDANDFPMPFFMQADKAAKKIVRGLERNKGMIAFPWQMNLIIGMLKMTPQWLMDLAASRIPKKTSSSDTHSDTHDGH